MFVHHLKVTFRMLLHQKWYALINILGLAIGMACCILIYLFVQDELTYDTFHEHKDRIYCALRQVKSPDRTRTSTSGVGIPAGPEFKSALAEVNEYVRIWRYSDVIRHEGKSKTEFLTFVDPTFFDMFTFPLIAGDAKTVLARHDAVVITEVIARQYYGSDDPMDRSLLIKLGSEFHSFTVSGVAEEIPSNSSIKFNFLLPLERARDIEGDDFFTSRFGSSASSTFLFVDAPIKAAHLSEKLNTIMPSYMDTSVFKYRVQPLTGLHLDKSCLLVARGVSNPVYSYVLSSLALLVLLIACFNFMNLAVARSANRVKEIGIRKVIGAHRSQLLRQFWSEALILSVLALLVGIVLAELLLPTFNSLANKKLHLDYGANLVTLLTLGGLCLLTGLLAGCYPALVLSGFRPVEVLKNRLKFGGANFVTRTLIIVQFSLSIFLFWGTAVMGNQLEFMKTKDLGFDDQNLISIFSNTGNEERLFERYKNEIGRHHSVLGVTRTDCSFSGHHSSSCSISQGNKWQKTAIFRVDYDHLATVGLRLLQGRNFSPEIPSDKNHAVLVNETLSRRLDQENPVGSTIKLCMGEELYTIIGIVEDFHYWSLHHAIEPVALHMHESFPIRYLNVRINPDSVSSTLAFLRDRWERVAPNLPFEYNFVGEWHDQLYQSDERWQSIIGYSSALAILIACLGLFGLSALSTEKRAKEICIRKIHGASVFGILRMITWESISLVSIAGVLTWPVGYWIMNRWLQNFAYRESMGLDVFVISGVLTLIIAAGTVSFQAIKAALANPVDSLRHE